MATTIRPEISNKSKWHISRERYYELKHFCLQYPEWKKKLAEISYATYPQQLCFIGADGQLCNPTEKRTIDRDLYLSQIEKVDRALEEADKVLSFYLLQTICYGKSFTYLQTVMRIPCCKDVFYDRYRKFFWILDKIR